MLEIDGERLFGKNGNGNQGRDECKSEYEQGLKGTYFHIKCGATMDVHINV